MNRLRRLFAAGAWVLVAAGVALDVWSDDLPYDALHRAVSPTAIPLAVLGDSNSHSYQDRLAFPAGSSARGGTWRARTFNWPEVVARLRGNEIDLGPWVVWGSSGLLASGREALGLDGGRAPRKEDYLYNFANSGAICSNLMAGRFRQAPRLVSLMDKEPGRWKHGVVVIRIGLNDWAGLLDVQSHDPDTANVQAVTRYCTGQIGDAIALIHASHPGTRVLVVGFANEADDPEYVNRFVSASESANIKKALDSFNGSLRELAQRTPNTAFFDDDAWLQQRWGGRGPDGKPAYKTVTIGGTFRVTNTAGDDPHNALVGDHHAGLVWNALWAQALVARLREAFKLPLTPISDEEVARFVLPLVQPAR